MIVDATTPMPTSRTRSGLRGLTADPPEVVAIVGIYLLSRIALFVTLATVGAFVTEAGGDGGIRTLLTAWDGDYYLRIADSGYPDHIPQGPDGQAIQSELAFFWGIPACIRVVDALTPLDLRAAAVLTMLLVGAVATVAVWSLARLHLDGPTARRAAALFAFAPGAFILSFVYTEGLMIAGAAGAMALARRERWIAAGCAGAVATASRPTGIVVVVILVVLAVAGRGSTWRRCAAPVIACAGALTFFVVVGLHVGDLGFWFRVEREAWGESFDFGLHSARQILGLDPADRGGIALLLLLATVVLAIGLLLLATRESLAKPELLYSVLVIASSFGSAAVGLRPRLLLLAFPLLYPLARWVRPAAFPYVLVASSTAMVLTGALSSVTNFTVP
jgi:hypothetical protein